MPAWWRSVSVGASRDRHRGDVRHANLGDHHDEAFCGASSSLIAIEGKIGDTNYGARRLHRSHRTLTLR
jgi:hypothetical protein